MSGSMKALTVAMQFHRFDYSNVKEPRRILSFHDMQSKATNHEHRDILHIYFVTEPRTEPRADEFSSYVEDRKPGRRLNLPPSRSRRENECSATHQPAWPARRLHPEMARRTWRARRWAEVGLPVGQTLSMLTMCLLQ